LRIINTSGESGEFLSAIPCQDTTFLLVIMADGSLVEWNIKHCRVVSQVQTSETIEAAATSHNSQSKYAEQICSQCHINGKCFHQKDNPKLKGCALMYE
jgi:hypothetical protein